MEAGAGPPLRADQVGADASGDARKGYVLIPRLIVVLNVVKENTSGLSTRPVMGNDQVAMSINVG